MTVVVLKFISIHDFCLNILLADPLFGNGLVVGPQLARKREENKRLEAELEYQKQEVARLSSDLRDATDKLEAKTAVLEVQISEVRTTGIAPYWKSDSACGVRCISS